MNTRRRFLRAAAALAAAVPAGAALAQNASNYGIEGRLAPELKVPWWIDADGDLTEFSLAMHKDKWVFLKCWQSWCPGCHSHGFPTLVKLATELADVEDVVFAGIQTVFEGHFMNTQAKVRETQLEYGLKIPMGHDPGRDDLPPPTMRDYRTGGTPWMVLIAPDRRVVFNGYGVNADKAIEYLRSQTA